jgi:kinesin family protein 11
VHAETVRIVEEQVYDLDVQMQDLDGFVTRAKSYNATLHERHAASVQSLNATVEQSFSNISGHFKETFDRVQTLGEEMDADANNLQEALEPLDENICQPLAELRDDIQHTNMREYEPTGETPEKIQYQYPTQLPRTGAHENLIAAMRDCSPTPSKPSTPVVLPDISLTPARSPTRPSSSDSHHSEGAESALSMSMSLREVNANMTTGQVLCDPSPPVFSPPPTANNPALKPNTRSRLSRLSKKVVSAVAEGPENVPPPALRNSTRRKSPRLH